MSAVSVFDPLLFKFVFEPLGLRYICITTQDLVDKKCPNNICIYNIGNMDGFSFDHEN